MGWLLGCPKVTFGLPNSSFPIVYFSSNAFTKLLQNTKGDQSLTRRAPLGCLETSFILVLYGLYSSCAQPKLVFQQLHTNGCMAHFTSQNLIINGLNVLHSCFFILMPFLQHLHQWIVVLEIIQPLLSFYLALVVCNEDSPKKFRAGSLCLLDCFLEILCGVNSKFY